MSDLQYYRPKTLKEALKLLDHGIPLAGGTALVPHLKGPQAVIDLQNLGLDRLKKTAKAVVAGAAVRLQMLLESGAFPDALSAACRLEASLNLRNMATLGGTIMSGCGRSPLLTALLALDAEVRLEPSGEKLPLDDLLDRRLEEGFRSLITSIRIPLVAKMAYDQVARTPYDRPLVSAAVAMFDGKDPARRVRIVLGGFGLRPQRVPQAELAVREGRGFDAACTAAREAFAAAEDHRASGEYRSHVAGILVGRLLTEVMG